MAPRIWQLAKTMRGKQSARALRAGRDYKVATLGINATFVLDVFFGEPTYNGHQDDTDTKAFPLIVLINHVLL